MTWWGGGTAWTAKNGIYSFKKQWGPVETRHAMHCLPHSPDVLDAGHETPLGEHSGDIGASFDQWQGCA